jgi:hypothetical protein
VSLTPAAGFERAHIDRLQRELDAAYPIGYLERRLDEVMGEFASDGGSDRATWLVRFGRANLALSSDRGPSGCCRRAWRGHRSMIVTTLPTFDDALTFGPWSPQRQTWNAGAAASEQRRKRYDPPTDPVARPFYAAAFLRKRGSPPKAAARTRVATPLTSAEIVRARLAPRPLVNPYAYAERPRLDQPDEPAPADPKPTKRGKPDLFELLHENFLHVEGRRFMKLVIARLWAKKLAGKLRGSMRLGLENVRDDDTPAVGMVGAHKVNNNVAPAVSRWLLQCRPNLRGWIIAKHMKGEPAELTRAYMDPSLPLPPDPRMPLLDVEHPYHPTDSWAHPVSAEAAEMAA